MDNFHFSRSYMYQGYLNIFVEMQGIIPQAFEDIFAHIEQSKRSDHFLVRASYLEIYNEEIHDLLIPNPNHAKLELKESGEVGIYVKNLTSITVQSVSDIKRLLTVYSISKLILCI